MKIGFVLPSLPNYSETFLQNQIIGLDKSGFVLSLFINFKTNNSLLLPNSVAVHLQPDINRKIRLFFILSYVLIIHPVNIYHFIRLELISGRSWREVIRNILINSHILNKQLDWLHFGFATMGRGRENVAQAIGAESAVSFRGFDIGLYPHEHPGCFNLLWDKIDKVHTISDDLYQKAIELGLDPKTPLNKITPAINTKFFKSDSFEDIHEPLRILTIGRLHWKKGYEYALKALSLLIEKQINFEYHIVGEGNHREAIIYAIHQLGLIKHVKLKGALPHNEVKQEMEWADIYIQPSIQEGFCNAVLEAQAMGLLCIVTNAEGLSENVLDGKTGWVVLKRSPEPITKQIIKIKNIGKLQYNKIRKNAIARVNNQFRLTDQIKNWTIFYKYD